MEQEHQVKSDAVIVPLPFFQMLMRCYYAGGPRDGDTPSPRSILRRQAEDQGAPPTATPLSDEGVELSHTPESSPFVVGRVMPAGHMARGWAAKKEQASSD